jgi:hypothetical protein
MAQMPTSFSRTVFLSRRCDEGYYGQDCARRRAGLPLQPSRLIERPWITAVIREPPAAMEPPPAATRKRPLIYVYDLEPLFQSKLLQVSLARAPCMTSHMCGVGLTAIATACDTPRSTACRRHGACTGASAGRAT